MSRPPHVCIVSCLHPPNDVRVMHKECMAMRAAGLRVTWVGPEGPPDADTYGVEFRFYPKGNSRQERLLHAAKAIRAGRHVDDVDVFFAVEPDSAYAAGVLARLTRARAVFDVHEAYDETTIRRWVPDWLRPGIGPAVRQVLGGGCRMSDLVIGVNATVLAPYSHIPTPQMIVRSCAPRWFADSGTADVLPEGQAEFIVVQGKSSLQLGTATIVRAAGIAGKLIPGLRVVLFDHFDRNADPFTREDFWTLADSVQARPYLDLRPMIPMRDMPAVLRSADAGLVAPDRRFGETALPNKVFEFLAAGLPIIAPEYAPEIARIVRAENCGLLVDTESPDAVANALIALYEDRAESRAMGERARAAFLARFSFETEFQPFIEQVRAWAS